MYSPELPVDCLVVETCQNLKVGKKSRKVADGKRLQTSKHVCQCDARYTILQGLESQSVFPCQGKKRTCQSDGIWALGTWACGNIYTLEKNTSNTRHAEPVSRFSLLSVCFVCLTVEEFHLFRVQKVMKHIYLLQILLDVTTTGQTEHKNARLLLSHRITHKQWKEPITSAPNPIQM